MTRLLDVASFETAGQEDKEVAGIRVRVATAAAPVAVPPGEGFERFARQCVLLDDRSPGLPHGRLPLSSAR